jgi:hypothetical protein
MTHGKSEMGINVVSLGDLVGPATLLIENIAGAVGVMFLSRVKSSAWRELKRKPTA